MATWGVEAVTRMAEAEHADGSGAPAAHDGISFQAWAFVLAGVGDGLPMDDLFSHLDLDEDRWQRADAAFNEALLDDVEASGTLTELLDAAMRDARKSWTRPIPPLDVDLGAWLTFYTAWVGDATPMGFLATHGLRAADIHRLQDSWKDRLAEEPSLLKEALKILSVPPGPVPELRPEAPRLIVTLVEDARTGQTGPISRGRGDGKLPFAVGEAVPAHPPLSVPIPRPIARRAHAEQTRAASGNDDLSMAFLPFAPPQQDVAEPVEAPSHVDAASEPDAHSPLAGDPVQQFTIQRYAELCADLIASAGEHDDVLKRYRITPLQKAELDAYWTQRMSEDPDIWLAWDRACIERSSDRVELP